MRAAATKTNGKHGASQILEIQSKIKLVMLNENCIWNIIKLFRC